MYIGSTDTRGLMHCLWEIIDNGVDEALAGVAKHIEVTLHPDGSAEVYDDGRGIPVDKEPRTGPARRRGDLHQAARRREVRRRLLRRHRRPARRRRLRGQRAVDAARRRRRPVAGPAGDVLPARRARRLRGRRARRAVRAEVRADPQGRAGRQDAGPAPGSGSGRTGRSSPRTRRSSSTTCSAAPGRRRSSCPASSWSSATCAARRCARRSSATTAASPSSPSS